MFVSKRITVLVSLLLASIAEAVNPYWLAPVVEKSPIFDQVSLQKLLTGYQQLPVERRKAVTIGVGRWLKPLTIQVPDVISNLLPSSSNIIKVHDSPKNQTKPTKSAPQPPAAPITLPYDPYHLLTNFDQNNLNLMQNLAASNPHTFGGFVFPPNATFGFDESSPLNYPPLFAPPLPPPPPSRPYQSAGHNNEKFQTVPLFEQDDSYQGSDYKRPALLPQSYFGPANHNSYPDQRPPQTTSGEEEQDGHHPALKHHAMLDNPMMEDESEEKPDQEPPAKPAYKNRQPTQASVNNQDYYQQAKSNRGQFVEPASQYDFKPMPPSQPPSHGHTEADKAYYNKEKERLTSLMNSFSDDYENEQRPGSRSPYFESEPYFPDYSLRNTSGISKIEEKIYNQEKNFKNKLQADEAELDDELEKMENSEGGDYKSYYPGFRAAASMITPVMVKSGQQDSEKQAAFILPMNVFPNVKASGAGPRPVSMRIKEFLKSMIQQRS